MKLDESGEPVIEHFEPREQPDFWELLDQDEVWIPKNSAPVRLGDMTPTHRENLRNWLRNRAMRIALAYTEEPWLAMAMFNGDMAQWSCEQEAYRRTDEVFGGLHHVPQGPEEWIESLPLMKKLVELDAPPSIRDWEV